MITKKTHAHKFFRYPKGYTVLISSFCSLPKELIISRRAKNAIERTYLFFRWHLRYMVRTEADGVYFENLGGHKMKND